MDPGKCSRSFSLHVYLSLTPPHSNIFGCNCEGGCRKGPISRSTLERSSLYVESSIVALGFSCKCVFLFLFFVSRRDDESR